MDKTTTLFFQLLQVAIGSRATLEVCPSEREWNALYALAEKHSLIGVCFAGIEKLPKEQHPGMNLLMDWLGQAEYIKAQNEQANKACVGVWEMFRKEGFRTCIMKGQGNSRLYKTTVSRSKFQVGKQPETSPSTGSGQAGAVETMKPETIDLSSLRTSGDIDLWVDASASSATENFEKVNAFVQRVRPTKDVNELEIQFGDYEGVPVEVHYKPFFMRNPWKNRRLLEYLNEEADNCFESESGFTTLRFNRIHQLVHIHHHLMTEGIGLRQLMDYYFVLVSSFKFQDGKFWPQQKIETMQVAKELGLKRFTAALMWVLGAVFESETLNLNLPKVSRETLASPQDAKHKPETAFWMLCEPNEKDGKVLLEEIMASGNFGHQDERGASVKRIPVVGGVWKLFIRNLKLWRFDPWDWLWGPLWRVYHLAWRKVKGFK